MKDTKKWHKSMGVNGGLLAVLGVLGPVVGVQVTPPDISDVINSVGLMASGVGGVLAVIGRVRAKSKIG